MSTFLLAALPTFFLPPGLSNQKKLAQVRLYPVELGKPNVDGDSIINLQQFNDTQHQWSQLFAHDPSLTVVKKALKQLVVSKKDTIERFDFRLIQSFSASKSFMNWNQQIDAAKYDDALHWGRNLYPGSNLAFATETDFQNNINHVMREGAGNLGSINVQYYDWYHRYSWLNTGGSHHAAALVHQLVDQNRQYKCRANLTSYHINALPLQQARDAFHLLVAPDKCQCVKTHQYYYLSLLLSNLKIKFSTLEFPSHHSQLMLYAIPKQQRFGMTKALSRWIDEQKMQTNILCFYDMLDKPERYF